jgi:hypothetical protein
MPRPSKDEILDEIRRCASANDGVPLGIARFEVETGIRRAEWTGRYWARWGDAVREAGFEANTLQGQTQDDDEMLAELAIATRELGRYPTIVEMRMRRIERPSFPNSSVVTRRFGSREEQLQRLAAYAAEHADFQDIAALCESVEDPVNTAAPTSATAIIGVVYLMKSGRHYKIGKTRDLGRRQYEIALQQPERLRLVHAIETDDPDGIERYWHQRFASQRANGEWFDLSAADVAAFKRRRRFM